MAYIMIVFCLYVVLLFDVTWLSVCSSGLWRRRTDAATVRVSITGTVWKGGRGGRVKTASRNFMMMPASYLT